MVCSSGYLGKAGFAAGWGGGGTGGTTGRWLQVPAESLFTVRIVIGNSAL